MATVKVSYAILMVTTKTNKLTSGFRFSVKFLVKVDLAIITNYKSILSKHLQLEKFKSSTVFISQ